MRLAIDARELGGRPTGVGRYLRSLLEEWAGADYAADARATLIAPVDLSGVAEALAGPGLAVDARVVPGDGGTWWEQTSLARAAARVSPDLLFAPAYTGPVASRVPLVVTVHDVSFAAHPEWFTRREGRRRRWLTGMTLRRARRVITVSGFSRDEIVRCYGTPAERIAVVWSGVDRDFAGHDAPGAATLPAAARAPRVLYAGSIFNRRHVPALIRAFGEATRALPGAHLDIVGENRTYPREDLRALVASLGLGARVTVHDYVPDGALGALYARARIFAFLSEYEGFGLPPLEAMAAGAVPLVLDTPVAREVLGDAARLVARSDHAGLVNAMATLLGDDTVIAALSARAAPLLARYTWARAARETWDILAGAARRSP